MGATQDSLALVALRPSRRSEDANQKAATPTKKNGREACRTLSLKEIRRDMRIARRDPDLDPELFALVDINRPKTRADCGAAQRPCLFVSCRYHLYLEVNPENGSVKLNFPDLEPWELPQTCALDAAEEQGLTLDEVGQRLNLTRERTRQLEWVGLAKIRSEI